MLKLITTNQFKLLLCTLTLVLMQLVSFGQSREIRGTVKDKLGEAIPGATVKVKGTNTAVVTGNDGSFVISAPNGATLTISFVGFTSEDVKIGETNNYNVVLTSDNVLNDVVVVGYGAQRKRDLTGATSTVNAKEIMQNPVMSPEQALQGRAAGVRVMQSNGAPGGAVQVQIRGVSSTSSNNQPLYVLDGIPLFDAGGETTASAANSGSPQSNLGSPIANLNPNDIESMEVLKDASATAIYGARASNGVVLITTKRGKAGKTKFNLDYYRGVQQLGNKLDLLTGEEGMIVRNTALLNVVSDFNRRIDPEAFNPFSFGGSPTFPNTDWQNELFRNAGIQDVNLSASGGTDKVRYMISGNYFSQEGIVLNTNMDRVSTRINLDIFATDKLKFGTSTALSYQNGNNVTTDNPFQGTVISAIAATGYTPAYNPDGTYFGPLLNTGFWSSRNGVFEAMEFTQNIKRNRATSNIFGEYEIIKGLKFKSSFGVDYTFMDQRRRNPSIPRGPQLIISGPDLPNGGLQRVSRQNRQGFNWVAEQTLAYTTNINKIHQIDALLGFSAQSFTNESLFSRGDGSLNPLLDVIGSNLGINFLTSESFEQQGLVSQFARVNYSLLGRYLVTANVRRDGSSKFGPANRYGVFPSISAGWRVSDEPFFEPLKSVINDLKFKASYGLTGNQEIGNFAFLSRVTASNYTFGSTVANGTNPNNFANANLRWEENEQTDIGLEMSLLKGRISVAADYYVKNANGLLFNQSIPSTSGFGGITGNLGKIQNKGFEFTLNTYNLTGAFKWNTNFNISTLDNEVISLGDNLGTGINQLFSYGISGYGDLPTNVTRVGLPIASFYGYLSDGIFQNYQETVGAPRWNNVVNQPGDLRIRDISGPNGVPDGIITTEHDRVVVGSPFPDFFGGLSNDFSYKNFSLNIFVNFSVGNEVFNQQRLQLDQGGNAWGGVANLNAWSPTNTSSDFPRLTLGAQSQMNRITIDRWLEDASFLRIRNITLGYNIPEKLLGRYKVQSLRLYTSVSNAFTFTKYKGWDPEINSSGSAVLSAGIDQTGYPLARTFQLGLNVGF